MVMNIIWGYENCWVLESYQLLQIIRINSLDGTLKTEMTLYVDSHISKGQRPKNDTQILVKEQN